MNCRSPRVKHKLYGEAAQPPHETVYPLLFPLARVCKLSLFSTRQQAPLTVYSERIQEKSTSSLRLCKKASGIISQVTCIANESASGAVWKDLLTQLLLIKSKTRFLE